MIFGKQTEIAIAAMSYLAQIHAREPNAATASEVAEARRLPKPFVAKVLTTLAQRGLVTGTQGRKGGYALARAPSKISLIDIAACFERSLRPVQCPFGPEYCASSAQGGGTQRRGESACGTTPCPLHHEISRLYTENLAFMERTTLEVFATKGEATSDAGKPKTRSLERRHRG